MRQVQEVLLGRGHRSMFGGGDPNLVIHVWWDLLPLLSGILILLLGVHYFFKKGWVKGRVEWRVCRGERNKKKKKSGGKTLFLLVRVHDLIIPIPCSQAQNVFLRVQTWWYITIDING